MKAAPYAWIVDWSVDGTHGTTGPGLVQRTLMDRLRAGEGTSFATLDEYGIVRVAGRIVGEYVGDELKDDLAPMHNTHTLQLDGDEF